VAVGNDVCTYLPVPDASRGLGRRAASLPREQIGICLSGRVRVEAGNGDTREFGAGAIWWMADTTGSGHTTTVLGDEDVRMCIVQLGPAQKT
jgi:quercetin dioxygenase-like cupin family protein